MTHDYDRFECFQCRTTFYSHAAYLLHNLEKHSSCSWHGRTCGDCARWLHRTRTELVTMNGEEQTIEVSLLSVCRIHKHQVLATDAACGPEFTPK